MKTIVQQRVAIAALFIWIGFVAAISFMEAWLKFQAPGVTIPIGLGIGRLVFGALNKVEWILAFIIILSACRYGRSFFRLRHLTLVMVVVVLILQTVWVLPALDTRAVLHMQHQRLAPSNLHQVFIAMELMKVAGLFTTAVLLFESREPLNAVRH